MSEQNLPQIDFLDMDEATIEAAKAAVTGSAGYLKPPADAKESKDKNGNIYKRWSPEGVVIEGAWREPSKAEKPEDRTLVTVIQMKVRAGFPHQHERTWARFHISPQMMAGKEPAKSGHKFMHEKSVGAIATLLAATGFQPKKGGVSGKILNHLFPTGKGSTLSPLVGKDVMACFSDSPNKGAGAKSERQTSTESFLPYAAPAVPKA